MTDPVAGTVAAYDALAATYADCFVGTDLPMHREWLLGAMPSTDPVIDVGCGTGRDLEVLQGRGVPVVGVDLSTGMLNVACGCTGVPLVLGDIRWLPFADRSFAAAWCCAVIVHLPARDAAVAMSEIYRVLVPGGPLFLSLRANGTDGWEDFAGRKRWYTYYSPDSAGRLLARSGFAVEKIQSEQDAAHRDAVYWLAAYASAQ